MCIWPRDIQVYARANEYNKRPWTSQIYSASQLTGDKMGLILPLAWAIFREKERERERSKLTQIHFLTEYTLAVALFPVGALTLHSIHSLTLSLSLSKCFLLPNGSSIPLSLTFGSTSKIQVWRVSEVTSHTLYPNGKVQIRSQTVERGKRERERRKGRERERRERKRKTLVK